MRRLLAQDLLRLWETGLSEHPLDRALTILAAALPEMPWDDLADLPIGQRNKLLMAVREQIFGPSLPGVVQCPACSASLEFVLDASTLQQTTPVEPARTIEHCCENGPVLRFRLPNSRDLAAILGSTDRSAARLLLVRRCLTSAGQTDEDGADHMEHLTDSGISTVAAQMAERDPQAESQLELLCPACGHSWQVAFDIASFLWAELSAQAKRLLGEVDALAHAYGWPEADILSLSAARRQAYLEMAT